MNDSFYQELGKRIKAMRKQKGLTQEALCGSALNRSMLSQIENGSARPSLETLLLLSSQLDVPLSYLTCSDPKEEAAFHRIQAIGEIRRLFASAQYLKCAALCRAQTGADDEIAYLLFRCEVALTVGCLKKNALSSAQAHLHAAEAAVENTVYAREEPAPEIQLLGLLIKSVNEQCIPEPQALLQISAACEIQFVWYLLLLSHLEYTQDAPPSAAISLLQNETYRSYLTARIEMQQENYAAACRLLSSVCHHSPGFFTEQFALRDMELCCQKIENYKEAYAIARRRLALLEQYKK